jgi:hypothetical protein
MAHASRLRGLLLIATGALVFAGTNAQRLPAESFFPAVIVCGLGVVLFVRGNRAVAEVERKRIQRGRDPGLRNRTAEQYASRQASVDGHVLASLAEREARRVTSETLRPVEVDADEIVLVEVSGATASTDEADGPGFVVSTDVSFPVEIQESRSLAEQIQKLQRLREDGVITAEEFSIAKAKLLR